MMQDSGCRVQDAGYMIRDAGCRIHDSGYRMQDPWIPACMQEESLHYLKRLRSTIILHLGPATCIRFYTRAVCNNRTDPNFYSDKVELMFVLFWDLSQFSDSNL